MSTKQFIIRRALRKKVPVQNNLSAIGYTTIPDGTEECLLEVKVDLSKIANRIGLKAAKNSRGRSRYMEGAIIVTVLKRKRVET